MSNPRRFVGTITAWQYRRTETRTDDTNGNPGGVGRPRRAVEQEYLAADELPVKRWGKVVQKAVEDVEKGDWRARKWLRPRAEGRRCVLSGRAPALRTGRGGSEGYDRRRSDRRAALLGRDLVGLSRRDPRPPAGLSRPRLSGVSPAATYSTPLSSWSMSAIQARSSAVSFRMASASTSRAPSRGGFRSVPACCPAWSVLSEAQAFFVRPLTDSPRRFPEPPAPGSSPAGDTRGYHAFSSHFRSISHGTSRREGHGAHGQHQG